MNTALDHRRRNCEAAARLCLFMSLSVSIALMSPSAAAQPAHESTPKPLLLVVNQGDATVSEVDPAAAKSIATIHEAVPTMVGHEVAVSLDGKLAYLPLYGDSGIGRPGTDGDSLLVLNIPEARVLEKIPLNRGLRPHCPVLDPTKHLLYVTTELAQAVTVFDTTNMAVVGSVPTGAEQSHMLVLSRDGTRGYTANVSSGTVSVLDLQNRKLLKKISIAPTVQRIALSPDDRTVVTSDQSSPRLAFIDTATGAIRSWMPLPSLGYGAAFTTDGKRLLVTLPQTGQLAVIDLTNPSAAKLEQVIEVGPHPQAVLVRPDSRFAYVSCFGARYVSVVNLQTLQVVSKIDTGEKADGMAWIK